MTMTTHLTIVKYEGHTVQVWQADGVWYFQAAISTSAPLPAIGESGFETPEQAVDAAMALIDGDVVFWRNG
jgi:hypothetical protein